MQFGAALSLSTMRAKTDLPINLSKWLASLLRNP
jgi:hypothetical protein